MAKKNLKAFQPRKHHRFKRKVKMLLCVKNVCGTIDTNDISDGGMALDRLTAQNLPELKLGGIVSLRPVEDSQALAKVGRIVRLEDTELGVEFVC